MLSLSLSNFPCTPHCPQSIAHESLLRLLSQVAFTSQKRVHPSTDLALQTLLSPASIAPCSLPGEAETLSLSLPRFNLYLASLTLCQAAEAHTDRGARERQDLFDSQEQYVSAIRCCLVRVDLMTVRVRHRLGVPLQPGATPAVLAASFPGMFLENPTSGASPGALFGQSPASRPPTPGAESWPPFSTFFDFQVSQPAAFALCTRRDYLMVSLGSLVEWPHPRPMLHHCFSRTHHFVRVGLDDALPFCALCSSVHGAYGQQQL